MGTIRRELNMPKPKSITQQEGYETISQQMLASIILKIASTSTLASCKVFCFGGLGEAL